MSDLHEEIRKQLDADLGRINGIPIVPGRPWPNRPAPQYRHSDQERAMVAGIRGGKTNAMIGRLKFIQKRSNAQSCPVEPWMTLFRGRG